MVIRIGGLCTNVRHESRTAMAMRGREWVGLDDASCRSMHRLAIFRLDIGEPTPAETARRDREASVGLACADDARWRAGPVYSCTAVGAGVAACSSSEAERARGEPCRVPCRGWAARARDSG